MKVWRFAPEDDELAPVGLAAGGAGAASVAVGAAPAVTVTVPGQSLPDEATAVEEVTGAAALWEATGADPAPPITALLKASAAAWPVKDEAACAPELQASTASVPRVNRRRNNSVQKLTLAGLALRLELSTNEAGYDSNVQRGTMVEIGLVIRLESGLSSTV